MFYLKNKVFFEKNSKLQAVLHNYKIDLGPYGRILLRQLGTELFIRIMIEGRNYFHIKALAKNISNIIQCL